MIFLRSVRCIPGTDPATRIEVVHPCRARIIRISQKKSTEIVHNIGRLGEKRPLSAGLQTGRKQAPGKRERSPFCDFLRLKGEALCILRCFCPEQRAYQLSMTSCTVIALLLCRSGSRQIRQQGI